MILNKQILIKSLCKLRKAKNDSLKSAVKNNRSEIAYKRIDEIVELEGIIKKVESKNFLIII